MPVSLGEWRVRIGRFVHSVRRYIIRERKEKLLVERIRRLKLLQKRLLEKKDKSEDDCESKPNDLSVKVDNAQNESNNINSDTTNDSHTKETGRSKSTIEDEYTIPFFFTLLLSLFSLMLSLIFFFVFDFSNLLASYKSFLKWSYCSQFSWRSTCLIIIIMCSSLAYFVSPYIIKHNEDLQDNLLLIMNENANVESTIKGDNTLSESNIKENNIQTKSAIGKNYTLTDSRIKEKNATESAKERNNVSTNATIKEIKTPSITRDGLSESIQSKTKISKNNTIKDKHTTTELTVEDSTLPESSVKDNIAPKECHIDTPSTMTDKPSKRKTSKRKTTTEKKTVTESTHRSNNTLTETTIKANISPTKSNINTDNNARTKSTIEENNSQAKSTIKDNNSQNGSAMQETSIPSTVKDKSSKGKISRKQTTESTIQEKNSPTESTIKKNNYTATSVNKSGNLTTQCIIQNSNTQTQSTMKENNASSESTIKEKNTPIESTIKVHNTTTQRTINCSGIETESTIKDINSQTESTIKDTTTPIKPTIKDYNTRIELSTKDNTSSIQCAIKDKNTTSDSTIKENNTPTEFTIKANNTPTESTIKDRNSTTKSTIKDYNRSNKSTLKETKTVTEPTIKDYTTYRKLSIKDNTSTIQCAIKEKNTPSESTIKENNTPTESSIKGINSTSESPFKDSSTTNKPAIRENNIPSRTPTEENNNQPMKVTIAQAEYTIRSGTQKVLSGGKHGISSQIPSCLKGTTDDPVMQESTCLPEMILVKAGDVEQNPGPFDRSANIQEQELVNLAYDISPSKYAELCIAFGVSYTQSQVILNKHHLNVTGSLIEIFCEWKNRQRDGTDCRNGIAAALRVVHLDALGDKLSRGGYLPQEAAPTASLASEKDPLTTEQVTRCGDDFKTHYRTHLFKIKTDLLDFRLVLEFEKIYTDLVLLRNEQGTMKKIPLDYKELLKTKVNGDLPKRLMVEGEGGAGKTTFCTKMAWDWTNGADNFQEFDWVLVIPLRDIEMNQTVGDIARTYLSDSNSVQPHQIDEYILANPSKVFIILDGLDEYDGDLVKQGNDIAKIIGSDKFKECRVLVTTRPWKADQIKSNANIMKTYAFIAVDGFDKRHISIYINKYFADDSPASRDLIKLIEDNDVIKENMAPFPIYIAMLCILWRDSDSKKRELIRRLKTFSQLFQEIIISLKDHYVSKQVTYLDRETVAKYKPVDFCFSQIGKIALYGIMNKKLVYEKDDFSSCEESMETCCKVGVLSHETRLVRRQDRHNKATNIVKSNVFFPHKLFQEYLAGMYLASLFESDHEQYEKAMNDVIQRAEEFRYLLYFTASQTKSVATDVTSRLIKMGHDRQHILVDVTFEAYDEDAANMVGQHLFAEQKSLKIDNQMSAHTVSGYLFIMEKLTMETLIVSRRSCGPTVSRDLADVICSSTALTSLELSDTAFHDDFYSILESKVKTSKIERLSLKLMGISDEHASRNLARFLNNLPKLKDLTLQNSRFGGRFYEVLAAGACSREVGVSGHSILKLHLDHRCHIDILQHGITVEILFPNLEHLYFTIRQTVSPDVVRSLAHSGLKELSFGPLNEHPVEDEEYHVPLVGDPSSLEQVFSNLFPLLTSLTFHNLVIGNNRCKLILSSLKTHQYLKNLCVIHCYTDEELDPIVSAFNMENRMKVDIQHDQTQKRLECMKMSSGLADALCHRTSIQELTLMEETIFSNAWFSDENHRTVDSKVQKLSIEGCNLQKNDPSASRDLARFLCLQPCLIDLTIVLNDTDYLHDEFYHELASLSSSSKVQRLSIDGYILGKNDPSASRDLARFLCLQPCLIDLTIGPYTTTYTETFLHDNFYHELARLSSSSKVQQLSIEGCNLERNDPSASRDLATFICHQPCLIDLTIGLNDTEYGQTLLHDEFYHELARLASSSKNHFFNKKLHMDERSGEFRQMDLRRQREYIGNLLHPTLSEITPRQTSKAPEPPLVTSPDLDVPSTSAQSNKLPEVQADINIQEAIDKGKAPWNRSRIMVIGPAGVGKTSLIRRLTGQKFDPNEESTKGAKQDIVTKSAVNSWELVKHAQTANEEIILSIAMDSTFESDTPCSTGEEGNRSDPAIPERRGVELEHDQETSGDSDSKVAGRSNSPAKDDIVQSKAMDPNFGSDRPTLETPSTSSQQPTIKDNSASTREHRHVAESDIGHDEELPVTESESIKNRDSKRSTLGKGNMSEATKDESSIKVFPTIAKISQGITRQEITKVKSSKLNITYSMWDFGGQEIYYITHPLFLSWRSLYILVIPLHLELSDTAPREERDQEQLKGSAVRTHRTILDLIHFWLMSVFTHAVPDSNLDSTYEPKVLLIGTFAGKEGPLINEEKVTAKFQELKDHLGSNPYWKQVLSPMFGIDNQFSEDSEVNTIQDRIDGLIQDSEYMKVCKPTKWRTFLTEIEGSDQNTLTVKEARSKMKPLGINDDKVDDVLTFYHDIGHLIYHQGCELIVLKPQFLNSIVSNIITVIDDKKMEGDLAKYWRDLTKRSILSIELIKAVWKEHKGDIEQVDIIIKMMELFDLICEIPKMPDGREFFVPCRSSCKLDKKEILDCDDKVEFIIDFHHFLPDGFLHRFYVRMAQWSMKRNTSIQPTFHCRQMVFYIDNDHRVVMTNEIHSKEGHHIKVMIYAVTPYGAPSARQPATVNLNKNVIDHLHETLEDLKKRWARRIQYRVGIWCPRCAKFGDKEWFHIRDILKDEEENACCAEGCLIYVGGIQRAFNKGTQLPGEKQGYSSIGVHVDAANSSSVTGNTFIGQQNIIKPSRYSHGSEDDSLDEPSRKRDKKTNRKTDSTTDADERARRDKRTMIDGSKDDSLDGRPRKRKKKTNRQTDSSDEDGRPRGDKQTIDTVSDVQLNTLAARIPHDKYHHLSNKLGIEYNVATNSLQKHIGDYKQAMRECLFVWKNKTGGSLSKLKSIFNSDEVKLGGIWIQYMK